MEAGQLAQRLGSLSKRLHRRFNGRPELTTIEQACETISKELDTLQKRVVGSFQRGGLQKLHDPRPEVNEQDDPSPPPPQVPDEQKRQRDRDTGPNEPSDQAKPGRQPDVKVPKRDEHTPVPPDSLPGPDKSFPAEIEGDDDEEQKEGEATGLQSLDGELVAAGEEPLPPPPGKPTPEHRPPAKMLPLADMPDKDLRAFAKSNGVNTFRVKSENIIKGLERKGFTAGPVPVGPAERPTET